MLKNPKVGLGVVEKPYNEFLSMPPTQWTYIDPRIFAAPYEPNKFETMLAGLTSGVSDVAQNVATGIYSLLATPQDVGMEVSNLNEGIDPYTELYNVEHNTNYGMQQEFYEPQKIEPLISNEGYKSYEERLKDKISLIRQSIDNHLNAGKLMKVEYFGEEVPLDTFIDKNSLLYKVPQLLGEIGTYVLSAGAGALAGGSATAGITTASLLAGVDTKGSVYNTLLELGADEDKARKLSDVAGISSAIANAIVFKAIKPTGNLDKVKGNIIRKIYNKILDAETKNVIKESALASVIDAGVRTGIIASQDPNMTKGDVLRNVSKEVALNTVLAFGLRQGSRLLRYGVESLKSRKIKSGDVDGLTDIVDVLGETKPVDNGVLALPMSKRLKIEKGIRNELTGLDPIYARDFTTRRGDGEIPLYGDAYKNMNYVLPERPSGFYNNKSFLRRALPEIKVNTEQIPLRGYYSLYDTPEKNRNYHVDKTYLRDLLSEEKPKEIKTSNKNKIEDNTNNVTETKELKKAKIIEINKDKKTGVEKLKEEIENKKAVAEKKEIKNEKTKVDEKVVNKIDDVDAPKTNEELEKLYEETKTKSNTDNKEKIIKYFKRLKARVYANEMKVKELGFKEKKSFYKKALNDLLDSDIIEDKDKTILNRLFKDTKLTNKERIDKLNEMLSKYEKKLNVKEIDTKTPPQKTPLDETPTKKTPHKETPHKETPHKEPDVNDKTNAETPSNKTPIDETSKKDFVENKSPEGKAFEEISEQQKKILKEWAKAKEGREILNERRGVKYERNEKNEIVETPSKEFHYSKEHNAMIVIPKKQPSKRYVYFVDKDVFDNIKKAYEKGYSVTFQNLKAYAFDVRNKEMFKKALEITKDYEKYIKEYWGDLKGGYISFRSINDITIDSKKAKDIVRETTLNLIDKDLVNKKDIDVSYSPNNQEEYLLANFYQKINNSEIAEDIRKYSKDAKDILELEEKLIKDKSKDIETDFIKDEKNIKKISKILDTRFLGSMIKLFGSSMSIAETISKKLKDVVIDVPLKAYGDFIRLKGRLISSIDNGKMSLYDNVLAKKIKFKAFGRNITLGEALTLKKIIDRYGDKNKITITDGSKQDVLDADRIKKFELAYKKFVNMYKKKEVLDEIIKSLSETEKKSVELFNSVMGSHKTIDDIMRIKSYDEFSKVLSKGVDDFDYFISRYVPYEGENVAFFVNDRMSQALKLAEEVSKYLTLKYPLSLSKKILEHSKKAFVDVFGNTDMYDTFKSYLEAISKHYANVRDPKIILLRHGKNEIKNIENKFVKLALSYNFSPMIKQALAAFNAASYMKPKEIVDLFLNLPFSIKELSKLKGSKYLNVFKLDKKELDILREYAPLTYDRVMNGYLSMFDFGKESPSNKITYVLDKVADVGMEGMNILDGAVIHSVFKTVEASELKKVFGEKRFNKLMQMAPEKRHIVLENYAKRNNIDLDKIYKKIGERTDEIMAKTQQSFLASTHSNLLNSTDSNMFKFFSQKLKNADILISLFLKTITGKATKKEIALASSLVLTALGENVVEKMLEKIGYKKERRDEKSLQKELAENFIENLPFGSAMYSLSLLALGQVLDDKEMLSEVKRRIIYDGNITSTAFDGLVSMLKRNIDKDEYIFKKAGKLLFLSFGVPLETIEKDILTTLYLITGDEEYKYNKPPKKKIDVSKFYGF